MTYTTPKGKIWEQTNTLPDGQIVFTSDDGRYVVVKPDIDHKNFFEIIGYGDPTELDELIGGEI